MVYSVSKWISKRRWWALWEVGGTADVGGARRPSGFCLLLAPKRREDRPNYRSPPAAVPPASTSSTPVGVWWPLGCPSVVLFLRFQEARSRAEKPRPNQTNQIRAPSGRPACALVPPPLSPALGLRRPGRPGCPPVPWKTWGKIISALRPYVGYSNFALLRR